MERNVLKKHDSQARLRENSKLDRNEDDKPAQKQWLKLLLIFQHETKSWPVTGWHFKLDKVESFREFLFNFSLKLRTYRLGNLLLTVRVWDKWLKPSLHLFNLAPLNRFFLWIRSFYFFLDEWTTMKLICNTIFFMFAINKRTFLCACKLYWDSLRLVHILFYYYVKNNFFYLGREYNNPVTVD